MRCLSKFLIGLLLKYMPQHRHSLWVLSLMVELEYGFSPHLDVLVAADGNRRKELDEVCFERTGLAPDAAKSMDSEAPHLWNGIITCYAPQIIDAELIGVMIEEV